MPRTGLASEIMRSSESAAQNALTGQSSIGSERGIFEIIDREVPNIEGLKHMLAETWRRLCC